MNSKKASYAVLMREDEIEDTRSRIEYDRAVMPYSVGHLNTMPAISTARYEDIPLQHFNLINTDPSRRLIGVNHPMPQNARQLNKSFTSINDMRVEGRKTPCIRNVDHAGYGPREAAYELNGLPRSKSVRHGINQRFLRNEASSNTISSDITLQMLRHNTLGCINDIPLLATARGNASVEGFSSRENIDQRFLSCNTRSDDVALHMQRLNINDISLSASNQSRGKSVRCNPNKRLDERPYKEAPPDDSEMIYENMKRATEFPSVAVDVPLDLEQLESESEKWEDGQDENKCRVWLIIGGISFVASLTGAAVYSLIGCTIAGCVG